MPYITQASVQELQERMDAVAVVSDYVRLEKKGDRYWACCPFHQEKTPSFAVNPEKRLYHCFGCQKGGSIIDFVMEMDSLSYPEAIEVLAKKVGLELVYESSGGKNTAEEEARKKTKDDLFELYQRISGTFQHYLKKKPEAQTAKLYIISRGISEEMIERFRLGYAPGDRYWLFNFLLKKGYSREFLALSGLFSSRYDEGFSLFSGRLIFPISDRQGRTAAFGGRFIAAEAAASAEGGREAPKYINSPESAIYKKRETLYGLDLALPEIKRTKTAFIAEGNIDVIALHQAGITNAVAPLGTSFTEEQAKLLKRWAEKIILFFDSDEAGQKAAIAAIFIARKNGLSCSVVYSPETGPEAKDPADILKIFGPEALQRQAKCNIVDFEYLLNRAETLFDSGSGGAGSGGRNTGELKAEGKVQALAFLFPYIDLLDSEVLRGSCFEAAADRFGLLPDAVTGEYRRHASSDRSADRRVVKPQKEGNSGSVGPDHRSEAYPIRLNDELSLLLAVAVDYVSARKEKLFMKFRTALDIAWIEDRAAKELYIALEECIRYGEAGTDDLLARISSQELRLFFIEHSSTGEFSGDLGQFVADGIKKLKGKRLKKQQEEIIIKLRSIKNVPEGGSARDLLAEKMRIDGELDLLMQGS